MTTKFSFNPFTGNFDLVTASLSLTTDVTGILPLANGGTGAAAFTTGSVIFMGTTTLAQDNANFFWDDTTNTLIISNILSNTLRLSNSGFEIVLQAPTLGASYTLTLPVNDGAAAQALTTDGAGVLTWVSYQAPGNYITDLTGDVTATGPGSVTATIANNAVTNAKLADMATQTFKGRTTAGTGDPEDLTATQATAMLNNFVGDTGSGGTKGLVPAPATGDAAAGYFLSADGTFKLPTLASSTVLLTDEQSSGTPGGGIANAVWTTRDLNTTYNSQAWVTLTANQFILDDGVYLLNAASPAAAVDRHKIKIYNDTDSVDEIIGTSSFAPAGDSTISECKGFLTVSGGPKNYEIQHMAQTSRATDGLGIESSFGVNEVYSTIIIEKFS